MFIVHVRTDIDLSLFAPLKGFRLFRGKARQAAIYLIARARESYGFYLDSQTDTRFQLTMSTQWIGRKDSNESRPSRVRFSVYPERRLTLPA